MVVFAIGTAMFFAPIPYLGVATNPGLPRPQLWHTLVIHKPNHRMPLLHFCYNRLLLKLRWIKKGGKKEISSVINRHMMTIWGLRFKFYLSSSNFLNLFNLDFKYHILKSPESFRNYIPESNKSKLFWNCEKKCEDPQIHRTKSSGS